VTTDEAKLAAIQAAIADYEAALERREHGAVAADRFIRAVSAVIVGEVS
jgi:hypothetical protein